MSNLEQTLETVLRARMEGKRLVLPVHVLIYYMLAII